MISSFFGLETAKRALQSQQAALNVTGHNIANANSLGYTRQIAVLNATAAFTFQNMGRTTQIGTGVNLDQITRSREFFIDSQLRNETSSQQYWTTRNTALNTIQGIMNEPTDNSLRNDMDAFWNAWSELSTDPESLPARTVVMAKANSLVESFHNISTSATEISQNLNNTIAVQIKQINTFVSQIADLNDQIYRAESSGGNPNDLKDKRDLVIDELSEIISVKVDDLASGFSVTIGDPVTGTKVVDGKTVNLLTDFTGDTLNLSTAKGSLLAALEIRGDASGVGGYIQDFMSQFDELALGIATAVNALHTSGQDLQQVQGEEFFDTAVPIKASNIKLNASIVGDVSKIAAASIAADINPGDGSIALKISSLSEGWAATASPFLPSTASSFAAFYTSSIVQIGVDVQKAESMQSMKDAVVAQLANQRDSVSGVNLDEEIINLTKYQKSFAAAARVVTMMDDLLDTIINGMGITR